MEGELCCLSVGLIIICFVICSFIEISRSVKTSQNMEKPEIKCPYCGTSFLVSINAFGEVETQRPTSTAGNIGRGIVFLPWGVVSAAKNKPYIQCPHCKMKIQQ